MHIQSILVALAAASTVSQAALIRWDSPFSRGLQRRQFGGGGFDGGFGGGGNNSDGGNIDGGNNDGGNNDDANNDDANNDGGNNDDGNAGGGGAELSPDVIQTGSQQDGNPDAANGEAASATDDANFINFCEGEDLTNGEQKEGGSCNGIPMGKIPATDRMVSAVITNPQNGDDIPANQDFTIDVQMINFAPGTFTNADTTCYSAPQDLDGGGNIIGHTHVTVQDTGDDLNPTQPLDPTVFAFFKGINDAGNGQGLLSADVEGGLPAGNYRLCTMAAAANHQPVIMPVAQRGAQDDCVRFTVSEGGGGGDQAADDQAADDQAADDQAADDQAADDQAADDQAGDQGGDQAADDQAADDQAGGGFDGGFGGGGFGGDFGGGFGNNGGFDRNKSKNNNNADDDNQRNSDRGTNGSQGKGRGGASSATAFGGIAAPEVKDTADRDRPFGVKSDTFVTRQAAVERACKIQRNQCFDRCNAGQADGFARDDCDAQVTACETELSG